MKAEALDVKDSYGEVRLFPETIDDLWHLSHLVAPGDLIFATTFRSVETPSDKLRPEKAEKRPIRLGIRVEKVSFHEYANRLRIAGVIEQGTDAGSYHTVNLEIGAEISVIKQWKQIDRERIDRAVAASAFGVVHILTIEEGEAELFRIRQYGAEQVAQLTAGSGKGAGVQSRQAFFESIRVWLAAVTGPIIVAGPGFVKDDFMKYLRDAGDALGDRSLVVETRRTGRGAVQEVIGLGMLERLSGDLQLKREVEYIEELLNRIGAGRPVAYGKQEVAEAIAYGAVQYLLVADQLLRDTEVEVLLEEAERRRATIIVFSAAFEPGKQLTALGGVAALLRFPIS